MWDLNSSGASLLVSFESVVAKEKFKIDMEWNKRKMAWKVSEKSGVVITGCFIWEEESSCCRVMLNRQGNLTRIYI